MLGKLRIRLSTLQPWTEMEARLPMLADRDKGCSKVAHAHLSLKVRVSLAFYQQKASDQALATPTLD